MSVCDSICQGYKETRHSMCGLFNRMDTKTVTVLVCKGAAPQPS
jgi:hypothetical protein